jgi:hypothetical protein
MGEPDITLPGASGAGFDAGRAGPLGFVAPG